MCVCVYLYQATQEGELYGLVHFSCLYINLTLFIVVAKQLHISCHRANHDGQSDKGACLKHTNTVTLILC